MTKRIIVSETQVCFLLSFTEMSDSLIHPLSKALTLFKIAECWISSQYTLVGSLSKELAHITHSTVTHTEM